MYDDDNSMDFQLIYNQHVVTYNELRGMKPMGIIAHWDDKKKNNYLQTWKCNKKPYDVTQKNFKELIQLAFFSLGLTIKQTIIHKHEN